MRANEMQVGGQHYKTELEHWDWMLRLDMGVDYLVGCATKYVSRWRKKNGMQDLQKALHYVNKLIENRGDLPNSIFQYRADLYQRASDEFAIANSLTEQEADFCFLMSCKSVEALYQARDILLAIMEQADAGAAPVPLEDSNKHADRA